MGAGPEFPLKKKLTGGSASSLPGCWEVPWGKRGSERHLSAKGSPEKARFPAIGLRGQRGEEGRKALISYLFIYCMCVQDCFTYGYAKEKAEAIFFLLRGKVLLN